MERQQRKLLISSLDMSCHRAKWLGGEKDDFFFYRFFFSFYIISLIYNIVTIISDLLDEIVAKEVMLL